jgi:hypothetical protein
LLLAGVWSQAVGFMLLHLAGIWLKSREDVFNLIWFIVNKLYKFCIFNAICKNNATRNLLLFVTHKKGLFPSGLTAHTLG